MKALHLKIGFQWGEGLIGSCHLTMLRNEDLNSWRLDLCPNRKGTSLQGFKNIIRVVDTRVIKKTPKSSDFISRKQKYGPN